MKFRVATMGALITGRIRVVSQPHITSHPNITNISSQAAVQTTDIRGGVRGDSECVLALKILHCLAAFSRCFEKGLARSSHRL